MKRIYTSVDLGSDSIKIIVAELYQGKISLLASTSYKSRGIKKGLITDVELASESVKNALLEVEDMLGLKIRKVIVNVPSFNAEYSIIKGDIKLNGSVVSSEDVMNALEVAVRSAKFATREKVTVLPVDYTLDDNGFLVYSPKFHPPILIAIIISLVATLIIIGIQVSKNKMVKQATFAHDYIDRNSILYTRKADVFYNSRTTSYTTSSSSGGYSGGGGGGSRGGSSGGGHSGGGRRG